MRTHYKRNLLPLLAIGEASALVVPLDLTVTKAFSIDLFFPRTDHSTATYSLPENFLQKFEARQVVITSLHLTATTGSDTTSSIGQVPTELTTTSTSTVPLVTSTMATATVPVWPPPNTATASSTGPISIIGTPECVSATCRETILYGDPSTTVVDLYGTDSNHSIHTLYPLIGKTPVATITVSSLSYTSVPSTTLNLSKTTFLTGVPTATQNTLPLSNTSSTYSLPTLSSGHNNTTTTLPPTITSTHFVTVDPSSEISSTSGSSTSASSTATSNAAGTILKSKQRVLTCLLLAVVGIGLTAPL